MTAEVGCLTRETFEAYQTCIAFQRTRMLNYTYIEYTSPTITGLTRCKAV